MEIITSIYSSCLSGSGNYRRIITNIAGLATVCLLSPVVLFHLHVVEPVVQLAILPI